MRTSGPYRFQQPIGDFGRLSARLVLLLLLTGCEAPKVDFNAEVRPILNDQCVTCHGGIRQQGDLSLLFREDALQAGESGRTAIVPGDAAGSELIRRVTHPDARERMPADHPPLSQDQVATLRRWIDQGAAWAPHWAYQPPDANAPAPPSPQEWGRGSIDAYVAQRLAAEGLTPTQPADCAVLRRRVSLDLIGLPPPLDAVEASCADDTPAAYNAFVDSLLASPHFGEHWASLWLDLARYADTQGFEKDPYRSIWRYRDWVIEAFNADLPFDRFTRDQLAGDLLPDPTEAQLIATAFHRNTMTNDEGGTDDEEFRVAAVIDRVNTTMEVWQGTTMACVQCHGHPYDAFRHEDFYGLFAFFNNTTDADWSDDRPKHYAFTEAEAPAGRAALDSLDAIEAALLRLADTPAMTSARRAWEQQLDDPAVIGPVWGTSQAQLRRLVARPEAERDDAQRAFVRKIFAEAYAAPQLAALRARRTPHWQALGALHPTTTPIVKALPAHERRQTHVFERGNFLVPTTPVAPATPPALGPQPPTPDRLGLAAWLVAPENPLTARVMVNRYWASLFGTGLVETTEDFGTQGTPPTHKALLDHLAGAYQHTYQWRLKPLLREIVRSATYQQASNVTPALQARDPQNRMLARGPRHRLSAEQLRDQALAVSGLLTPTVGGPSVYPYQPPGLWLNPYSSGDWPTSTGPDRYRRGLYTYWRRTVPYPAFVTFDAPSREFCRSRRDRTNTPLQALVTLNDPAFVTAAEALAHRVQEDGRDADAQISRLYQHALLQPPSPQAQAALRALYDDALAALGTPHAALSVVANAVLNLDAFLTKS